MPGGWERASPGASALPRRRTLPASSRYLLAPALTVLSRAYAFSHALRNFLYRQVGGAGRCAELLRQEGRPAAVLCLQFVAAQRSSHAAGVGRRMGASGSGGLQSEALPRLLCSRALTARLLLPSALRACSGPRRCPPPS